MKRVTELDRRFGKVLRDMRIERGLSMQEVASKTSITYQQLQKYEAGINRVSISRLFEIADALEVSPASLIYGLEQDCG